MVKIIKDYLNKFPNLPSLTLARKIYKDHPELSSVDNIRTSVRRLRGQLEIGRAHV